MIFARFIGVSKRTYLKRTNHTGTLTSSATPSMPR
jgi:hypothetical protein